MIELKSHNQQRSSAKANELMLNLKEKTIEEHAKAEIIFLRSQRQHMGSKDASLAQKSIKMVTIC